MAQFYSISICTEKTSVIFTGSHYFFYSNFFGLLAVAERDENNDQSFSILVGNRYTLGGRVVTSKVYNLVCNFIKKQYKSKDLVFERKNTDLADNYLNINLGNY